MAQSITIDAGGAELAQSDMAALIAAAAGASRGFEVKSEGGGEDPRADPTAELITKMGSLVERQAKAHEELKSKVDKLAGQEAKGGGDAVTKAEIAKLDEALTTISAELKSLHAQAARPRAEAPTPDAAAQLSLKSFNAARAAFGGEPVDHKGYADYSAAIERFFRKGKEAFTPEEVKAVAVGIDPAGGALLAPTEVDTMITRVLARYSGLQAVAGSVTTGGRSYTKLVNLSGMSSGWVGETEARPETGTPQFDSIEIQLKEVYARPYVSQLALEDSAFDVAGIVASDGGIEFGERVGAAVISGDGVTRPRGLLSYPTVANASYAWGSIGFVGSGSATGIADANNILSLIHALRRQYRANGAFIMNDLSLSVVRQLRSAQGEYYFLPNGGTLSTADNPMIPRAEGTIFGYPVYTDDFMPDFAANAFPMAFGDFAQAYLVVTKAGTDFTLRDPYSLANQGQVVFHMRRRVGGGVVNFEAVKLLRAA
ncbi:MAG: phage major capsid protein [Sphingomonadaceae bacterium]|nr:phage major capsid protein [Sphingomonadaceae bacterium]